MSARISVMSVEHTLITDARCLNLKYSMTHRSKKRLSPPPTKLSAFTNGGGSRHTLAPQVRQFVTPVPKVSGNRKRRYLLRWAIQYVSPHPTPRSLHFAFPSQSTSPSSGSGGRNYILPAHPFHVLLAIEKDPLDTFIRLILNLDSYNSKETCGTCCWSTAP